VPHLYVSDSALSDSATWTNSSFSSLGVTPGTYVWTWGSGADADSLTLDVVPAPALSGLPLLAWLLGRVALLAGRRRWGAKWGRNRIEGVCDIPGITHAPYRTLLVAPAGHLFGAAAVSGNDTGGMNHRRVHQPGRIEFARCPSRRTGARSRRWTE
jgi:hypothetical protein